jgi:hypothetical protein
LYRVTLEDSKKGTTNSYRLIKKIYTAVDLFNLAEREGFEPSLELAPH